MDDIISHIQEILSNQLYQGLFGAFFGAFFAFIFSGLASFFKDVLKQHLNHCNTLAKLQVNMNMSGSVTYENIQIAKDIIKHLEKGNITFNRLKIIEFSTSALKGLKDLNLFNELYSHCDEIRRVNDDIESLSLGIDLITKGRTEGTLTPQGYLENAKTLAGQLKELVSYLNKFFERNTRLFALIRIQSNLDTPLFKSLMDTITLRTTSRYISNDVLNREVEKIENEVEENRKSARDHS